MIGETQFKKPAACSKGELREFARLVREGFRGSDEGLPDRIERARLLAFCYATDDWLVAIAGLKSPNSTHRRDVFAKASVSASASAYSVELGWVYVVPTHRRKRIAQSLCRSLLAFAPGSGIYATTRPDNVPMIRILLALGFERVGRPFPRRDEELVVFLRK